MAPMNLKEIREGKGLSLLPGDIAGKIYAAYEAAAKSFDGFTIPAGQANTECDRALWYAFRWAYEPKPIEGRMLRLFKTGNYEEERVIRDLELVGIAIYGQQDDFRLVAGHLRGKRDGLAINIPEDEKTQYLLEAKSVSAKWLRKIQNVKLKLAKPEYYGQCQLGMHAFGLSKCLFVAVCKDTDTIYTEVIDYDLYFSSGLVARMTRIVERPNPPPRLCKDECSFQGNYCKAKDVCWHVDAPRRHCRTCLHVTPEMDGEKGRWSCARHSVDLSYEDQPKGCVNQRFIPGLIPGEQVDADKQNEIIIYRLPCGTIWRDDGTPL